MGRAALDASTRELLSRVCGPLPFDREGLAAAMASFQMPRDASQGRVSWSSRSSVGLGWCEGATFRIECGPGVASVASFDATRRERTGERASIAHTKKVDLDAADLDREEGPSQRQITQWSSKSRARMVRGFASVDWSVLARCYCGALMDSGEHMTSGCTINQPLPQAMVTLTYPGDWLAVCPDGKTAKEQLAKFRERWRRALGWRLDGAWKLEFQRPREDGGSAGQEAPHFHLLVPVPARVKGRSFGAWLASTWADVVGATGQERVNHEARGTYVSFKDTARMSDPKRCAVYFLKHGTKKHNGKEYQHVVPKAWQEPGKGPGRFWGFWGMKKATVPLDLDLGDWITARRVLRRVARARARSVAYSRAYASTRACGRSKVEATRAGVLSARGRKLWTLGVGGQLSGGWVVVNDGVSLAGDLVRAINLRRDVENDWGDGVLC